MGTVGDEPLRDPMWLITPSMSRVSRSRAAAMEKPPEWNEMKHYGGMDCVWLDMVTAKRIPHPHFRAGICLRECHRCQQFQRFQRSEAIAPMETGICPAIAGSLSHQKAQIVRPCSRSRHHRNGPRPEALADSRSDYHAEYFEIWSGNKCHKNHLGGNASDGRDWYGIYGAPKVKKGAFKSWKWLRM